MIYLLTQDKCPKCDQLKLFLEKGLNGKYDAFIEIVHRQQNPELFQSLVEKHKVLQTPCLISKETGDILRNPDLNQTPAFLQAHTEGKV